MTCKIPPTLIGSKFCSGLRKLLKEQERVCVCVCVCVGIWKWQGSQRRIPVSAVALRLPLSRHWEETWMAGDRGRRAGQIRQPRDCVSSLLCCSSSSRASGSNAETNGIQEKPAFPQDAFDDVVKYFGENPKTTPPSVFFPVFVRFVKAYKVSRAWCPAEPSLALFFQADALSELDLSFSSSAEACTVGGSTSGGQ